MTTLSADLAAPTIQRVFSSVAISILRLRGHLRASPSLRLSRGADAMQQLTRCRAWVQEPQEGDFPAPIRIEVRRCTPHDPPVRPRRCRCWRSAAAARMDQTGEDPAPVMDKMTTSSLSTHGKPGETVRFCLGRCRSLSSSEVLSTSAWRPRTAVHRPSTGWPDPASPATVVNTAVAPQPS